MINGIRLKVCGITSLVDAEAADMIGADYLGFNLHPKSPRYLPLVAFRAFQSHILQRKKVAVMVRPTAEEIAAVAGAGFDFIQPHFDPEADRSLVESWSPVVESERLWLAPRLPPGEPFPDWLFPVAGTFLVDTFHKDVFGGTGATGNWTEFRDLQAAHPEKKWILAGGLKPDNIAEAIAESSARFVDLCSGVELAPGIKDPDKLKALAAAMRANP